MSANRRRSRSALPLAALALSGALALPRSARADAFPLPPLGWYLPVGVNAGGVANESAGPIFGAEVSLVRIEDATWTGLYVDGIGDPSNESFRLSFGPEIGLLIFGLDGGFLLERNPSGWDPGFTLRGLLTVGVFTLYGRYGNFPSDTTRPIGEFGALIKYPFELCWVRKGPDPDYSVCPF